jgi:hypothetical protein
MKKGQTWKDPETAIDIKIESDRAKDGRYRMSISKPGFVPVIMRQKSLPTDEKTQDKMLKKLDGMLKKEAKKTQKKNDGVSAIHLTDKRTFRISESKKKKIDSKPSSRRTKKRKVIGNRGTVFTVYGNKSRRRRKKKKTRKMRKKKTRKMRRKKRTKRRRK